MKKIFYICTKTIENWDIFTPLAHGDSAQSTMSLLLLHQEQHLENVYVSQVWYLNRDEQDRGGGNTQKKFSYQDFLEQVFSHDLAVVI
jgi:hypothetical protein